MLLVKEKGNIYVFQEDRWWKQRLSFPEQGRSVVLTVILSKKRKKKRNLSVKDVMSYKEISYRKGR